MTGDDQTGSSPAISHPDDVLAIMTLTRLPVTTGDPADVLVCVTNTRIVTRREDAEITPAPETTACVDT